MSLYSNNVLDFITMIYIMLFIINRTYIPHLLFVYLICQRIKELYSAAIGCLTHSLHISIWFSFTCFDSAIWYIKFITVISLCQNKLNKISPTLSCLIFYFSFDSYSILDYYCLPCFLWYVSVYSFTFNLSKSLCSRWDSCQIT